VAESWWLVPGDARALTYPDACACCGADTTARWDVVPYCDACRAHVPTIGPWSLAIGAVVLGCAAAIALRSVAAFAPLDTHVLIVAAIAIGPLLGIALLRARGGTLAAPHVDRAQAAEITRAGVLARSRAWAERVAEANGGVARETTASRFALAERVLPWLACALPIAFVVVLWPTWHFDLWIDNGTAADVTVRADGTTIATVAAGEHERVELPRRRQMLAATGDAPVALDPRDKPTWLLNVARAHCYERRAYEYSETGNGLLLFGERPERIAASVFAIDARWMFETPPNTITTDRPKELRALPEVHYALAIVPCR
jgi:hypothetical protein